MYYETAKADLRSQVEKSGIIEAAEVLLKRRRSWESRRMEYPADRNHFFSVAIDCGEHTWFETRIDIVHYEDWQHKDPEIKYIDAVYIYRGPKETKYDIQYRKDWCHENGLPKEHIHHNGVLVPKEKYLSDPTFLTMEMKKMDWEWLGNKIKLLAIKEI